MFTKEEVIVRSKFVYKFPLTVRIVKVSSFQRVSNTGILAQLVFKLYQTDKNWTSLRRMFHCWRAVFTLSFYNKYWDILLKNTSHQDKSCKLYHCGKVVCQISSKSICYYIGWTHVSLKHMFVGWTHGL